MAAFNDKVVIITGASEGIGRALALALAPQKPKLALAARNEDRLRSLKDEIEALGAEGLVVPTDVTDEAQCHELIDATVARWKGIDVLVANAGGTMWTLFEEIEDTSIFERLMRLNYLGSVYPTYYALPHLKKRRGRIVGVSSVAGLTGVPTRTAYSASKHAMFGFFDSLRVELMGSGVSVTMVAPDFVLSEVHKRALGSDGQPLGRSPLQQGKIMTADECAARMVPAIEARQRLVLMTPRSIAGYLLKFAAPKLVDHVAAKAIRDKK